MKNTAGPSGIAKIAMLLLAASVTATGIAHAQDPADEPPPYPGNQAEVGAEPLSGDNESAPDPAATVTYFRDQLSPYGQWVEREGYGEVWVPRVEPTWRPYTSGHWVNTDQGWAWVADESWGWAPFHYGRWFYDRGLGGWAWVPGSTWAPAWVAWRHGGGYLGWAPLTPSVGFSSSAGLIFRGPEISFGFYTFVSEGAILSPRIETVILPTTRNTVIVRNTTNITNYTVINNRIINRGVDVHRIEQVTGRPVPRVAVASLATSEVGGRRGAFYQPPLLARQAAVPHAEFGRALTNRTITQPKSRVADSHSSSPRGEQRTGTDRRLSTHDAATHDAATHSGTTHDAATHDATAASTASSQHRPANPVNPPASQNQHGKEEARSKQLHGAPQGEQQKKSPPKEEKPKESDHKPPV